MVNIADGQFELGGIVFGGGVPTPQYVVTDFDPGTPEWTTQDAKVPHGDALMFGRDTLSGPTWTFEIATNVRTGTDAFALAENLAKVWRADSTRSTPGAVVPLRYRIAGRTKLVYGRPRRFSVPRPDYFATAGGKALIICDFQCADPMYYDDVENSMEMDLIALTTGGLLAPLSAPLATQMTSGTRDGQFNVGGSAPAWAVVTFYGPVTNPEILIDGAPFAALSGTLAYDQSVTIDPRPWARTATRNDGAGVGGLLSPSMRMAAMKIEPGWHEMTFNGIDQTNTARVTMSWRAASYSL